MPVRLTRRPLRVEEAYRALSGRSLGGVVVFLGRVRPDRTPRGRVTALFYEAHRPLALASLRRLAHEAVRRQGAQKVVLWHRLGTIPVGEPSVLVGVAAGHREDAFAAARYLIDRLKAETPIWKSDRVRAAHPRRPRRGRQGGRSTG